MRQPPKEKPNATVEEPLASPEPVPLPFVPRPDSAIVRSMELWNVKRTAYDMGYKDGINAALLILSIGCLTTAILFRFRGVLKSESE